MKALILAAGVGANLVPFTTTRPKAMISVGGRYLLENTLLQLRAAGVRDVIMVVGHRRERITAYFERGARWGMAIDYLIQESPRSIAQAVGLARERFEEGEYFLLAYADVVTDNNIYLQTLQTFASMGGAAAAVCHTPETGLYGNVYLGPEMRIDRLVEKPGMGERGNYVLAGAFVLPYRILDYLEEGEMEQGLSRLIAEEGLYASIWEGGWVDACYPWDILRANRMVMDSWQSAELDRSVQLRGDVQLRGPVRVEEDVVVESGTVMVGPCFIGRRSFVGNNVLIRPYTCVGPESTVGYGVELKNCVLFGRAKVGRLSFVGDSVVGEDVEVGSGTMTINNYLDRSPILCRVNGQEIGTGLPKLGAFIGDGARVGASNTLMAGTVIPAAGVIPHSYSHPRPER